MRALRQKLKETFPFIKIDFVGRDWFEFFINDRIILLDNIKAIETFISDYNVRCNITWVWEWKEVNYDNLVFNNPNPTFRFFIRKSSKGFIFNANSIVNVSDTTDPLYDICLFKLQDKKGYPIGNPNRVIRTYGKTPYGFDISVDSLAEVTRFMDNNILIRKMSFIKQDNRNYIVRVYMKDKEYLFESYAKMSKQKRRERSKKDEIVDYSKLTKKELISLLMEKV